MKNKDELFAEMALTYLHLEKIDRVLTTIIIVLIGSCCWMAWDFSIITTILTSLTLCILAKALYDYRQLDSRLDVISDELVKVLNNEIIKETKNDKDVENNINEHKKIS